MKRLARLAAASAFAVSIMVPAAALAAGRSGGGSGGSRGGGAGGSRGGGAGSSRGGGSASSRGGGSGALHRGGGHVGGGHGGGVWHGGGRFYYPYWGAYWGGWGWYGWGGPWSYGPGQVVVVTGPGGYRSGRFAVVDTGVSPDEAEVYLDGKYIGTADDFDGFPDFLYLKPGKYHLEFRLPGYETLEKDVEVSGGQRIKVDKKLKRMPGTDKLAPFPSKKPMPYGRVFGTGGVPVTPESARPAADDDGPPVDARPAMDDPRPPRGPDPRAPADSVAPRRGASARLRIKVTPEDAVVYLDDQYLGAGDDLAGSPRGTVMEPGWHTLTVVRPGFKTKTVDVQAKPGTPVDVVVELEK
jgi:PEGA domain